LVSKTFSFSGSQAWN